MLAVFGICVLFAACENPWVKWKADALYKDKPKPKPGPVITLPGPVTQADLQVAITDNPSGSTIVLPVGTWTMDSCVDITKNITIKAANGTMVTLESDASLVYNNIFCIDGGKLTLEGTGTGKIIIDGWNITSFNSPLNVCNGGTLIINNGVTIQNNNVMSGGGIIITGIGYLIMNGGEIINNTAREDGGGVTIRGLGINDNGSFTMNGGIISGNNAGSSSGNGGGVYVDGGTFTMNNGTIQNNTANSKGGGVYVGVYSGGGGTAGSFTMNGGTIYGTDVGLGLANTASGATNGAALFVDAVSTAKYRDGSPITGPNSGKEITITGH